MVVPPIVKLQHIPETGQQQFALETLAAPGLRLNVWPCRQLLHANSNYLSISRYNLQLAGLANLLTNNVILKQKTRDETFPEAKQYYVD